MTRPRIEVEDLWEGYRRKSRRGWRRRGGEMRWAVKDVTFSISAGEMLGIIGRNGSGKSTLLQCLSGVLKPSRGTVVTRGRIGSLVDLAAGFHRELTGRENLMTAGVVAGMSRREVRERTPEISDFADLDDAVLDSPLRTYSAGMGLRLGFALTIVTEPEVLIVDEVLAVGDEAFQHKCIAKVHELQRKGTGVALVSHEMDLVESACDRVMVLHDGDMVFLGDVDPGVVRYRELMGGAPDEQDFSMRALQGRTRRSAARRARRGA
jgi:homopolymeric O-antigen transport system ATP-binding protein